MPTATPKLGIQKPLGNEVVSRQSFNDNWDRLDLMAARDPFVLQSAIYDAGNNKIDVTIGPGIADFLNALVTKAADTVYSVNAPAINTEYFIYLKSDGTFTHNTTGAEMPGGVLLWKVATGATVDQITTTDMRGQLGRATVQTHKDDTAPHLKQQLLYLNDPVTGKTYRFGIDGNVGRMYYEEVI